jgi:hypothetical protein
MQAAGAALHPNGKRLFPVSTTGYNLFGKSWESALARAFAGAGFPRPVSRARLGVDYQHQHEKVRTFRVYGG